MSVIFYNHQFYPESQPVISIFDRGFSLGDGIFETIKVINGEPELWQHHMDRMNFGCSVMGFSMPRNIYESAIQLIRMNNIKNCVLKIILSRESLLRGLGVSPDAKVNMLMMLSEVPQSVITIKAMITSIRRNDTSPLSRIKSLNYGDNFLAFKQAKSLGYDDALMLNTKGQICCFTVGNIVIQTKQGEYLTPPVQVGCLAGTFLSTIKNLHYEIFTLEDAEYIYRSNCITGLVKVLLDQNVSDLTNY